MKYIREEEEVKMYWSERRDNLDFTNFDSWNIDKEEIPTNLISEEDIIKYLNDKGQKKTDVYCYLTQDEEDNLEVLGYEIK